MKKKSSLTHLGWEYRGACSFKLDCTHAHESVSSRCRNKNKKMEACSTVCGNSDDCQEILYLTGKADCKGDTYDPNQWMVPEKTCCIKHDIFTDGKVEILPDDVCHNDNDQGMFCPNLDCPLQNIKPECQTECGGHHKVSITSYMWEQSNILLTTGDESCKKCVEKVTASKCGCFDWKKCYYKAIIPFVDCGGGQSTSLKDAEEKLICTQENIPDKPVPSNICKNCVCPVVCAVQMGER